MSGDGNAATDGSAGMGAPGGGAAVPDSPAARLQACSRDTG